MNIFRRFQRSTLIDATSSNELEGNEFGSEARVNEAGVRYLSEKKSGLLHQPTCEYDHLLSIDFKNE